MIVRGIDTNGDWLFGKGANDYKSGIDALSQNLQTRISSFLGDCFFDLQAGIDWFSLLGGKSELAIDLAVAAVILNTANVTAILQLSSNLDANRLLTLSYTVQTDLGVIQNSVTAGSGGLLLTEGGDVLTTEGGDSIEIES